MAKSKLESYFEARANRSQACFSLSPSPLSKYDCSKTRPCTKLLNASVSLVGRSLPPITPQEDGLYQYIIREKPQTQFLSIAGLCGHVEAGRSFLQITKHPPPPEDARLS